MFHALRVEFSKRCGFYPSKDYVLSELLLDPLLAADLFRTIKKKYPERLPPCPRKERPPGNRYAAGKDPNKRYGAGKNGQLHDWGLRLP
jgi:hypothetical protein